MAQRFRPRLEREGKAERKEIRSRYWTKYEQSCFELVYFRVGRKAKDVQFALETMFNVQKTLRQIYSFKQKWIRRRIELGLPTDAEQPILKESERVFETEDEQCESDSFLREGENISEDDVFFLPPPPEDLFPELPLLMSDGTY